jgi:hypothetical protein
MGNYECKKYLDHRLTMPVISPSNCSQVTLIAVATSEAGFFTIGKARRLEKQNKSALYTET